MKTALLLFLFLNLYAEEPYYYQQGKKIYLHVQQNTQAPSLQREKFQTFKTNANVKLILKDEIIIQLTKEADITALRKKYSLTTVEDLGSRFYLIKEIDTDEIFSLANRLYEDSATLLAHPNFIQERFRR